MPRKVKEPRLYLRRRNDGNAVFVILDRGRQIATGLSLSDRSLAEAELHRYRCGGHDRQLSGRGIIYFLTADAPGYPIKIGFTLGLGQIRMRSLQTACPYVLVRLGYIEGTLAQERSIHRDFEHLRLQGEWFRRDPELLRYIELACAEPETVSLPTATIRHDIQAQTLPNVHG